MIRLFKHYIPHAVLLLGMLDFALLVMASETAWLLRANQIGMDPGPIEGRWVPLLGSANCSRGLPDSSFFWVQPSVFGFT